MLWLAVGHHVLHLCSSNLPVVNIFMCKGIFLYMNTNDKQYSSNYFQIQADTAHCPCGRSSVLVQVEFLVYSSQVHN